MQSTQCKYNIIKFIILHSDHSTHTQWSTIGNEMKWNGIKRNDKTTQTNETVNLFDKNETGQCVAGAWVSGIYTGSSVLLIENWEHQIFLIQKREKSGKSQYTKIQIQMIRLILHKSMAIDPSMAIFSFLTHRFGCIFSTSKRMQTFDEIHSFIGFHWICHFSTKKNSKSRENDNRYQVRKTSNNRHSFHIWIKNSN